MTDKYFLNMKLKILKYLIFFVCIFSFSFLIFSAKDGNFAQAATLTAGSASATLGDTNVSVSVSFSSGLYEDVATLNFDLNFDSTSFVAKNAVAGEAAQNADKKLHYTQPTEGKLRIVVSGLNQDVIPDGEVAKVSFDVLSSSSAGEKVLTLTNCAGLTFDSKQIDLTPVNGKILVNMPGIGEGSLIKTADNPDIYLIEGGLRRLITSMEILAAKGYSFSDIKTVNQAILGQYTKGSPVSIIETYKNAPLFKSAAADDVYAVLYNKLHWMPGPSIFNLYQFQWQNIKTISQYQLNKYVRTRLVRARGDVKIYVLNHRYQKRWLRSADVFESYRYSWNDILEILPEELNVYNYNLLIKTANNPNVYYLNPETGQKSIIKSMMDIARMNYLPDDITVINQREMDSYPIKN